MRKIDFLLVAILVSVLGFAPKETELLAQQSNKKQKTQTAISLQPVSFWKYFPRNYFSDFAYGKETDIDEPSKKNPMVWSKSGYFGKNTIFYLQVKDNYNYFAESFANPENLINIHGSADFVQRIQKENGDYGIFNLFGEKTALLNNKWGAEWFSNFRGGIFNIFYENSKHDESFYSEEHDVSEGEELTTRARILNGINGENKGLTISLPLGNLSAGAIYEFLNSKDSTNSYIEQEYSDRIVVFDSDSETDLETQVSGFFLGWNSKDISMYLGKKDVKNTHGSSRKSIINVGGQELEDKSEDIRKTKAEIYYAEANSGISFNNFKVPLGIYAVTTKNNDSNKFDYSLLANIGANNLDEAIYLFFGTENFIDEFGDKKSGWSITLADNSFMKNGEGFSKAFYRNFVDAWQQKAFGRAQAVTRTGRDRKIFEKEMNRMLSKIRDGCLTKVFYAVEGNSSSYGIETVGDLNSLIKGFFDTSLKNINVLYTIKFNHNKFPTQDEGGIDFNTKENVFGVGAGLWYLPPDINLNLFGKEMGFGFPDIIAYLEYENSTATNKPAFESKSSTAKFGTWKAGVNISF